jgi:hypothetical protein
MHGEDLGRLFEDLEQLAEGLHLAERDAELADRSRSEYAEVTFAARLHASVGASVTLAVSGVAALEGTLLRVGEGWCLLRTALPAREWLVCQHAVTRAVGLSAQAVSAAARPAIGRLTIRSALRGVADARVEVVCHHVDGTEVSGRLARIGADFVEVAAVSGRLRPPYVLPLTTLAAVRCGADELS